MLAALEQIKSQLQSAVPGARVEIIPNDSPSGQRSLRVDPEHAFAVAQWLYDDSALRLDYCSNVTGVDWPETEISTTVKIKKVVEGVEKEVDEISRMLTGLARSLTAKKF